MQRTLTPTLAIILAGGLAAGIGLARPAGETPGSIYQAPAGQPDPEASPADPADPADPYRRGTRSAGSRNGAEPAPSAEGSEPAAEGSEPAGEAAITIEGFAFDGAASAQAGSSIRVTNLDGVAHTLSFRSGQADTGTVAGGSTTTLPTPAAPGTYAYFCRIHPSMEGEIVLTG